MRTISVIIDALTMTSEDFVNYLVESMHIPFFLEVQPMSEQYYNLIIQCREPDAATVKRILAPYV